MLSGRRYPSRRRREGPSVTEAVDRTERRERKVIMRLSGRWDGCGWREGGCYAAVGVRSQVARRPRMEFTTRLRRSSSYRHQWMLVAMTHRTTMVENSPVVSTL